MSILRYIKIIEHLDYYIKRKATGNQAVFARKMGMSRSSLNIYLNEMKELGFPIGYCRTRNTYYYTESGDMVKIMFEKKEKTNL